MSTRLVRGVLIALVATALVGCGGGRQSSGAPKPLSGRASRTSRTSHVIVILMENKEYGSIVGSSNAPYINRLLRSGALATASYGVSHPSLPNYLALTGGSTFGIDSDCTDCHVRATNLVDQLEAARISWKAYMEGMPSPCFKGGGSGAYAKKHDPFVYYDDIVSNRHRCARVVPFDRLHADYRRGKLPTFIWITPNLCHDMHDCSVAEGDKWLSKVAPALIRALGPRGILFLTFDEGESDQGCCKLARGGRIATIVAGRAVKPGARSAVPYDHYSLLRTVEGAFGLRPIRGAACSCTRGMDVLFRHRPRLSSG